MSNEKNMNTAEQIVHPDRYNQGGLEVWDIEQAFAADEGDYVPFFVEHLRMGAIEYILRCWKKGGIDDLRKARNLLDKAIRCLQEEQKDEEVTK